MLNDLLTPDRVAVRAGSDLPDKGAAIALLADLLTHDGAVDTATVKRVLAEREALQSTGIGEGVAIPHGALLEIETQRAALLIVPGGMPFDAIDGEPVNLLFSLIGPKRATGEHLKTLARISRLLRNRGFRARLLAAETGKEAYDLIVLEETGGAGPPPVGGVR